MNTDDTIKAAFYALQTNVRWFDNPFLAAHGVKFYYAEGRFYVLRFGEGVTARYAFVHARDPNDAYARVIEGGAK